MKFILCKHGVESAILIESSSDYADEQVLAWAKMPMCQECANEVMAELVAGDITLKDKK